MKLKNISIAIFSTAIVLIVIYLLTTSYKGINNTDYEDSSKTQVKIAKIVDDFKEKPSSKAVIDFESITDFDWDALYLVSPYSVLDEFCDLEQINYDASVETNISTDDGIVLLLFVKNSEIVSFFEYPRSKGDFSNLSHDKTKYLKSDSKFFLTTIDNWIQFTQ